MWPPTVASPRATEPTTRTFDTPRRAPALWGERGPGAYCSELLDVFRHGSHPAALIDNNAVVLVDVT